MSWKPQQPSSPCPKHGHRVAILSSTLKPGHVIEVDGYHFRIRQMMDNGGTVLGTFLTNTSTQIMYKASVGDIVNACYFDNMMFNLVHDRGQSYEDLVVGDVAYYSDRMI